MRMYYQDQIVTKLLFNEIISDTPQVIINPISTIFSNPTVKGIWFDPNDFSTMYQDSAGTIPVTSVGQTVGKMYSKVGSNIFVRQQTVSSQPRLQYDSVKKTHYLLFDGIDDTFNEAASLVINSTGYSTFLVEEIGRNINTGNTKHINITEPSINVSMLDIYSFTFKHSTDFSSTDMPAKNKNGTNAQDVHYPKPLVISYILNKDTGTLMNINGSSRTDTRSFFYNFSKLSFGKGVSNTYCYQHKFYGFVSFDKTASTEEQKAIQGYYANLSGAEFL